MLGNVEFEWRKVNWKILMASKNKGGRFVGVVDEDKINACLISRQSSVKFVDICLISYDLTIALTPVVKSISQQNTNYLQTFFIALCKTC